MWGGISSSSWGKETIRDRVSYQTRSKSGPNPSQSKRVVNSGQQWSTVGKSMRRGFDYSNRKQRWRKLVKSMRSGFNHTNERNQ